MAFILICGVAPVSAQFASNTDAVAQPCSAQDAIRFRGLTVRLENDLFVDTDQNYTNGLAFTAVSHDLIGQLKPECLTAPVRLHAELIRYLNPSFWADPNNPAQAQNVVVKFGQFMFTPKDPTQTALILDDRPYAGLLYVGMAWNRRQHTPQNNTEILDTREITLGVIGPLALARPTQNIVHHIVGADKFQGWNNQLGNEPAFQMALDRKFKTTRAREQSSLVFLSIPFAPWGCNWATSKPR